MHYSSIIRSFLLSLLCWAVSLLPAPGYCATEAADGATRAASAGRGLVGLPAPVVTLRTIDGQRIALGELYGKKPVYLKFWATWCKSCLEQMPAYERAYRQYGGRIEFVAVNAGFSETESAVRAYRARHALSMPVVIDDGSLGRSLNLRVTPQHVLIGADGRIVHVGHRDDRQLHEALEQAASGPTRATVAPAPRTAPGRTFGTGAQVNGIVLKLIDGRSVALGATGRPQALVFFSPWCESYLRKTLPDTARACRRVREDSERLAAASGADWFGISAAIWSSPGELADYARTYQTRIPLALDGSGEAFAAFGIRRIPSVVLLDARGRVLRILGPDERDLARALRLK